MQDKELFDLWKTQDDKMNQVITLNRKIVYDLTHTKFNQTIGKLRAPKRGLLFIGVPYTLLLLFVTLIALVSGGVFVAIGFGAITLIMIATVTSYFYQLHLIKRVTDNENILVVQEKLAKLKISSINCARLAVLQLPFWSICWVSINALQESPLIYGGVNLAVFLVLTAIAIWLYRGLNPKNPSSTATRLFLSGREWEPIEKAAKILTQLKEYKTVT
jgi:glucan phosphoethanolaminetransferase (alkaline phosphatase superfamily)